MAAVTFDGTNFGEVAAAAGDAYAGPAVLVLNEDGQENILRPGWVLVPLDGGGADIYSAAAWARRQAAA